MLAAEGLRQGNLGIMRAWANYNPAMSFFAALGTVLVLWFGGKAVMAGTMTTGELVGFLFYLMLFYEPVARLHGLNQMLQSARAAGERVFDILDHDAERDESRDRIIQPVRGEVIYEDVFAYESDRPVLKDISLHAKPGQMIALVGPTGAGKSTLVSLLPAFTNTRAARLPSMANPWRKHPRLRCAIIAVVSQEPFLFNGTIRENIQYGNLDADDEAIEAAARAANCMSSLVRWTRATNHAWANAA